MNTSQFIAAYAKEPVPALPFCDRTATEYYKIPSRAYHTWEHINHVYACACALLQSSQNENPLNAMEKDALSLAISWHDVFQGPNHELASAAKLYQERPGETSVLAARLIVEGTTHLSTPDMASLSKVLGITETVSPNLTALINTIHDADLMILGEDRVGYDKYAREIAVEALAFGLGLDDYRRRRIQFLSHIDDLSHKGTLFKTTAVQDLNVAVIENVQRELQRLR